MAKEHNIPNPSSTDFKSILASLTYALLFQGECQGFEQITVNDAAVKSLTLPKKALLAIICVEKDTNATTDVAVRFTEDKSNPPTPTFGMPIGQLGTYEVKGRNNLENFKIIGSEADKNHVVTVQYYG